MTFVMNRAALLLLALGAGCGGATRRHPPSVTCEGSREFREWVALPDGSKVAVDRGVEWEGVKVYLSLLENLVAIDGASGRTLWSHWVSSFYNRLTIRLEDGRPLVEISSSREDGPAEWYRLRTGEKILAPADTPSGTAVLPLPQWRGRWSKIVRPIALTASTEENWNRVRAAMFDGIENAPRFEPVDFAKQVVLVVSDGTGWNCGGIAGDAWDDGSKVTVRLKHEFFQTFGGNTDVRAFGIFVLPRSERRTLLVQRNDQMYIGGPPIWKDWTSLVIPPDSSLELRTLRD
jgi:hypothetical protein